MAKPDSDRDAEIVLKIVAQASLPVGDARSATKPLPDRSDGRRQPGDKISVRGNLRLLLAALSRDENSGAARVIHRQRRLCYYSKSASGRPPKARFRSAAVLRRK